MEEFIISFNPLGKYSTFEEWNAANEEEIGAIKSKERQHKEEKEIGKNRGRQTWALKVGQQQH